MVVRARMGRAVIHPLSGAWSSVLKQGWCLGLGSMGEAGSSGSWARHLLSHPLVLALLPPGTDCCGGRLVHCRVSSGTPASSHVTPTTAMTAPSVSSR